MRLITTIYVIQNTTIRKLGYEVCDKTMLSELSGILNPTLRERIDKSIVGKLIRSTVNFGLGAPIKKNLKITDVLEDEHYQPVTRKFQ